MNKIPIKEVIVGERARKDYGDLTDLMESMRDVKLLQPIVLAPGNRLLAGGRRLEAARRLGWQAIPFHRAEVRDEAVAMLRAERDENTCRKPMTASELVALGLRIEALEAPEAKQRQGVRHDLHPTSSSIDDEVGKARPRSKTDKAAADALGLSESQYARQKRIVRASNGELDNSDEDQKRAKSALEDLDAGKVSVFGAYQRAFPPEPSAPERHVAPGITASDLDALNVPAQTKTTKHIGRSHHKKQIRALGNAAPQLAGIASALEYAFPGGFEKTLTPDLAETYYKEIFDSVYRIKTVMNTLKEVM